MIPPHRVTSSCRQSTAPAASSRAESASVQLYSPAATSASTWPRTVASPARSCDETGSSNQVTPYSFHPVRRPGSPGRRVPAVGVHVQLGVRADDRPGQRDPGQVAVLVAAPGLADLDLHPGNLVLVHPARQLVPGLAVVVAGEPAAAVDGHVAPDPAGQVGDRAAEQPRLQVPQRDVGRRDGGGRDARPADVAHGPVHRLVGARHIQRVPSGQHRREHLAHHGWRPRRPHNSSRCPAARPARAVTSTSVVLSQARVPSASGASVGITYTAAVTSRTGGPLRSQSRPAVGPVRSCGRLPF